MTNSIEKQAAYVSCMFVHHSAVFCQLFSVRTIANHPSTLKGRFRILHPSPAVIKTRSQTAKISAQMCLLTKWLPPRSRRLLR